METRQRRKQRVQAKLRAGLTKSGFYAGASGHNGLTDRTKRKKVKAGKFPKITAKTKTVGYKTLKHPPNRYKGKGGFPSKPEKVNRVA